MKKLIREDIRVEVTPHPPFFGEFTEEKQMAACRDLERAIKRHCDNIGTVAILYSTVGICTHCGSKWTEASDTYNGGCCEADEANNPQPAEIEN